MTNRTSIPSFSIKGLFESEDKYLIPVYQRNYSWELGQVKQLVQDIFDYATTDANQNTPYYIGTLVVYERKLEGQVLLETIDGQQRLTTLVLLLSALHRKFSNIIVNKIDLNLKLKFFSRPTSELTLEAITSELDNEVRFINTYDYNNSIKERYTDVEKVLSELLTNDQLIKSFYLYLTEKVHLIRVSVPEGTDLNHYFEIMNNRGEQLEKHEVLKANLLSKLSGDLESIYTFNRIWEAVSDMERYVQYGFTTNERDIIFSNDNKKEEKWNYLNVEDFESLKGKLKDNIKSNDDEESKTNNIVHIIKYKKEFTHNIDQLKDAPDRFTSVINFPGFLLHVLRIQTQEDIPLDDKRLIDTFRKYLTEKGCIEDFSFNLLKCKHLFDQYIIKREYLGEKDQWSLKKLKWYENNKIGYVNTINENNEDESQAKVLMLLSMFHVSLPSMNYKHWLSAALNYLYKSGYIIDSDKYANYLFEIAKSYFFDRVLIQEGEKLDYFEMIFEEKYKNRKVDKPNLMWNNLDQGTSVDNYAFNFLDYILWLETKPSFEFTFRSSVEHFYPQNPINGIKLADDDVLNCFGNLCLISSSKNSRLYNYMPMAKKDHYKTITSESLKLKKMMELTTENSPWDSEAIIKHSQEMISKIEEHYDAK